MVEVEGGRWKTCQVVPDLEISPKVGGKAGARGEVRYALYPYFRLNYLAWILNICHRVDSGNVLSRNVHKMIASLEQTRGSKMKDSALKKHLATLVSHRTNNPCQMGAYN